MSELKAISDWIPNPTPGKRPISPGVMCVIKFGEGGINTTPRRARSWCWSVGGGITHYKIVSLR